MSTNDSSIMSNASSNMSLQDWTDHINSRLDVIYKDLCDFEQNLNKTHNEEESSNGGCGGEGGALKLMELLEAVNEIRETARNIRPITRALKDKQAQMRDQMEMLQNSVELLQLENRTLAVDLKPVDVLSEAEEEEEEGDKLEAME